MLTMTVSAVSAAQFLDDVKLRWPIGKLVEGIYVEDIDESLINQDYGNRVVCNREGNQ